jgi:hypothetical protein
VDTADGGRGYQIRCPRLLLFPGPILFGGWRRRVLNLELVVDPAGADRPSRDDGRAVAVEMMVEGDTVVHAAEQIGQQTLTVLKPSTAEVLAVEFDEIEGAQHGGGSQSR